MYLLILHLTKYTLICVCLTLFSLVFRYGSGTLTKVFVDRVFQECLTYDGEMVSIYNHEY